MSLDDIVEHAWDFTLQGTQIQTIEPSILYAARLATAELRD